LIERGREYDTTHTEKLGVGHPLVTLKIYSFRYISKARISHKESFAMRRASSENVKINIVCTHCGIVSRSFEPELWRVRVRDRITQRAASRRDRRVVRGDGGPQAL
jgi:hypothetical protein